MDLTFALWVIVAPIGFAHRLIDSDGDVARHIVMGDFMLTRGWIDRDVFSFTKAGQPFLAYEWLSELAYALAHRVGGLAAVALFGGLLLATAYALVVLFLLRRGVDPLLAYLVGILAAIFGSAHWIARPHLFTFVAMPLLLWLLEGDGRRRLALFVPLFVLWANLHPGFVSGIAFIGAYLAGDIIEYWSLGRSPGWLARIRYHGMAFVLATASTVVNPHGIALLSHIRDFLGNAYIVSVTNEFQSPDFHTVNGKLLLLVLLAVIAALTVRTRRVSMPRLFAVCLSIAAALFSQRNMTLFAIVALPLLALEMDAEWRAIAQRPLAHVRRVFDEGERIAKPGRHAPVFALLAIVLAVNHGSAFGVRVVPDRFDPRVFPVAAVEWAKSEGLDSPMFNELIWGGYVLYAWWPDQRIYIDGMTDFYGPELVREYVSIMGLAPDWDQMLDARGVELVLIPPGRPLGYALERSGAWQASYADATAVIYQRTGAAVASPR